MQFFLRILRFIISRLNKQLDCLRPNLIHGLQCGPKCRIGRFPRVRVLDGGTCIFGARVTVGRYCEVTASCGKIEIGEDAFLGDGVIVVARETIIIGADCLIAERVSIRDQDHCFGQSLITAKAGFTTAPIIIGDNVWIGANTTITKGVKIGNNSVIGANSVVTRDVPADTVVAGVPARILRQIQ